MPKALVYQPAKWEKELKRKEKVWKQMGGQNAAYRNLQAMIRRNEEKASSERRYRSIYSNAQLGYKIIAGDTYLRDTTDRNCVNYTYLSGMSGILAHLFDTPELRKDRDMTEQQNTVKDFELALLQLCAVDQPIPACIQKEEHLYVKLLMGDFERASALLSETGTEFDPENPYELWIGDTARAAIQALIAQDENAFHKALTARIREYRRWPVGYSTFLDIFSIAFLKLAYRQGMKCEIDVIEIPKMFFDPAACQIDTAEVKPPFFDDAVNELKALGVELIPLR